ncbi:MAG: AraC family transcriptional regulator [Oscillospiraceae bacterium]|jgi:AraC-like DNA-binding protein|nr:AraC family transcriptional regulator [Oscillospiraceae bacterium]
MEEWTFRGQPVDTARVLYTPSAFARASLLHLQEAGKLQAKLPHTSRRSHLASYLFFVVLSGEGTLTYESEAHALSRGDCVFLDCQKPYAHATGEALWSLQWAHFYGASMPMIYQKYRERGGKCTFRPENIAPYTALLSGIYETAVSTDYIRDMRLNEQLSSLLTLLMAVSWSPGGAKKAATESPVLLAVKGFLDEHYAEKITLDALAERFYLNKFYLARLFKAQTSHSVGNYITILRVAQAKRLLRFSDWTMEKIGAACGMPDANYFSRVFRRAEGMSPSEYRRQW